MPSQHASRGAVEEPSWEFFSFFTVVRGQRLIVFIIYYTKVVRSLKLRSNYRPSEPGRFHSKNPGMRVSLWSRHRSISCTSSLSRTGTDRSARLGKRFAKASVPCSNDWKQKALAGHFHASL